jgi:hypothetical protein
MTARDIILEWKLAIPPFVVFVASVLGTVFPVARILLTD